jgi:hypothetical protein
MAEILSLNSNSVSAMIHKLTELYHDGQIEGLVLGVKLNNGEFICGFTNTISFLEKLGLLQAIINDIQYAANND